MENQCCDICLLNHPTLEHGNKRYAPIKVAAMPQPREDEAIELINLYHTAKTLHPLSRYDRMRQAARWFAQKHSDITISIAYKWLDRALE